MLGLDLLGDLRRRVLLGQIERDDRGPADLGSDGVQAVCRRATRISFALGSRAIRFAVASPMPLEAPVTSAITSGTLLIGAGKFRASGA